MSEGGSYDHGRKVFMRFDLPDSNVELANGQDLVKFNLVIRATHDGTGNVSAGLEGTRLWCTNGCTTSLKGLPHRFHVRHSASADVRMREAENIIAGAHEYVAGFNAAAEHMLDTKMTVNEFDAFIHRMWPKPEAESDEKDGRGLTIWKNRRDELMTLFRFAGTNDLGRDSRWAAFGAVTEWSDWHSTVRSHNGQSADEVRAIRHLEATSQDVKDKAFSMLVAA